VGTGTTESYYPLCCREDEVTRPFSRTVEHSRQPLLEHQQSLLERDSSPQCQVCVAVYSSRHVFLMRGVHRVFYCRASNNRRIRTPSKPHASI
jgi:hypothetical protein